MLKLRALVVFALVIAGLHVRNSSADTVYTDLDSGGACNPDAGWYLWGPNNDIVPGFTSGAAMSFKPSENCSLVSVDLAVGLSSGTSSITVMLDDDDSGAPGATLDTFQFDDSAMGPFPGSNPLLQAASGTNPILYSNDTYWLVVSANDTTAAVWNDNSIGFTGGLQQLGGGGWLPSDNPTAAFSITGNAELKPVPEPASIALFGAGIAAIFGFYLARKRRAAKLAD